MLKSGANLRVCCETTKYFVENWLKISEFPSLFGDIIGLNLE